MTSMTSYFPYSIPKYLPMKLIKYDCVICSIFRSVKSTSEPEASAAGVAPAWCGHTVERPTRDVQQHSRQTAAVSSVHRIGPRKVSCSSLESEYECITLTFVHCCAWDKKPPSTFCIVKTIRPFYGFSWIWSGRKIATIRCGSGNRKSLDVKSSTQKYFDTGEIFYSHAG